LKLKAIALANTTNKQNMKEHCGSHYSDADLFPTVRAGVPEGREDHGARSMLCTLVVPRVPRGGRSDADRMPIGSYIAKCFGNYFSY
jgi:hypothetical protein